ncbi:apolipoprotein L3-like [Arvicola amphibius]|uniref:apolipoprotein L3-like n=1 Tax=Arvicola amphibius TaxID=1047088 RepID=UPI001C08760F|nr:apolipoprotein L3-like [Arvicola amphibius]
MAGAEDPDALTALSGGSCSAVDQWEGAVVTGPQPAELQLVAFLLLERHCFDEKKLQSGVVYCDKGPSQEAGRIVKEVTDFLTKALSREDLEHLITEDGAWKAFVEAAALSSEQEAALRNVLEKHLAQKPADENDEPQKRQQKENFLKEFPGLKKKLEEHIRKLRDLADHLDQVHRGCTISNVVSGSTGIASALLCLGVGSITGGASLLLSAASLGLAATITSLATTVVEESSRLSDESEASRLVGASMNILNKIMKILPMITVKLGNTSLTLVRTWKTFKEQIDAIWTAKASSHLGVRTTGRIPDQGSRHVGKTLPSPALPVTRGARIRTVGFTSIILALDVYRLVTDSMDLYNGTPTQSATALRDLANKLEEKLQNFEQIHKALQSDPPQ